MTDLPKTVHIVEEGPREGFHVKRQAVPTARKNELIGALAETSLDAIQAVSFVATPQAGAGVGRCGCRGGRAAAARGRRVQKRSG